MDRFILRSFAIACALFAASPWVLAADNIESRQVHFAKGASSATLKGALKGDKTIDYKLSAKTGQTMRVTLKTSNGANYFNVLPPGSNDVAVFVGSSGGSEWTGQLAADGEYTIRGYGVIRGKPGNAEVHVTPPGGFKRVLTFIAGKVTADSGAGVKTTRSADEWLVDVNDYEHYRIPDAVISGG